MATDTVIEKNVKAFREFVQINGWGIITENEIQSGYELRVTDGRDKIPVKFYSTGKALIQGKSGALQSAIQIWWQNLNAPTSTPHSTSPKDLSDGFSSSAIGRTARFYVAQNNIERINSTFAHF